MPYWIYNLVLVFLLGGCASFRSYDKELYQTLDRASTGNVEGAIQLLESNNKSADKDLLYYLELGMLQRLGKRYDESQKTWSVANARIEAAGAGGLIELANFARGVGSYVVNDKMRAYAGYDYEKVMLLTYMALNYLAMGNYDAARVAIKQTHELEARIAEARAKQIAEVEESAQKRGARTSFRELNGYPIQTIDNPEVHALRNGYQSALSHYLAGFVYEALGEPSLAAPGYRLANELQPGQALLEEALAGLDQRAAAPDDGMADVLMIIGTGSAPALQSRQFMLPVQVENKLILIAYSFPVLASASDTPMPTLLNVDGRALPVVRLTSVDLMARRRLLDEMPGIMLRATVRSTVRATMQYQAQRAAQRDNTLALSLAAGIVTVGSALFESADDRTWRALPAEVSVARARLPRGEHTFTLHTPDGQREARVNVSGRYAVVDLRLLRHQLFVNAPKVAPSN
jgi:uncharacterized protein